MYCFGIIGRKVPWWFRRTALVVEYAGVEAAAMGRFTGARDGDTVLTSTRAYQLSEEWFTAWQMDTGSYWKTSTCIM